MPNVSQLPIQAAPQPQRSASTGEVKSRSRERRSAEDSGEGGFATALANARPEQLQEKKTPRPKAQPALTEKTPEAVDETQPAAKEAVAAVAPKETPAPETAPVKTVEAQPSVPTIQFVPESTEAVTAASVGPELEVVPQDNDAPTGNDDDGEAQASTEKPAAQPASEVDVAAAESIEPKSNRRDIDRVEAADADTEEAPEPKVEKATVEDLQAEAEKAVAEKPVKPVDDEPVVAERAAEASPSPQPETQPQQGSELEQKKHRTDGLIVVPEGPRQTAAPAPERSDAQGNAQPAPRTAERSAPEPRESRVAPFAPQQEAETSKGEEPTVRLQVRAEKAVESTPEAALRARPEAPQLKETTLRAAEPQQATPEAVRVKAQTTAAAPVLDRAPHIVEEESSIPTPHRTETRVIEHSAPVKAVIGEDPRDGESQQQQGGDGTKQPGLETKSQKAAVKIAAAEPLAAPAPVSVDLAKPLAESKASKPITPQATVATVDSNVALPAPVVASTVRPASSAPAPVVESAASPVEPVEDPMLTAKLQQQGGRTSLSVVVQDDRLGRVALQLIERGGWIETAIRASDPRTAHTLSNATAGLIETLQQRGISASGSSSSAAWDAQEQQQSRDNSQRDQQQQQRRRFRLRREGQEFTGALARAAV